MKRHSLVLPCTVGTPVVVQEIDLGHALNVLVIDGCIVAYIPM